MVHSGLLLSLEQIETRMQDPGISEFVKNLVAHRLRTGDFAKIKKVTDELVHSDSPDIIKQAIIYLEHHKWNSFHASIQAECDYKDRAKKWATSSYAKPGQLQTLNPDIDRSYLVVGKEHFNDDLLKIVVQCGRRKWKSIGCPNLLMRNLDKDDEDSVRDINLWRHRELWKRVGPILPNTAAGGSGVRGSRVKNWHPLEETYIRNLFVEHCYLAVAQVLHAKIKEAFNNAWTGFYLPGSMEACVERTGSALTGYVSRKCVNGVPGGPGTRFSLLQARYVRAVAYFKTAWRNGFDAENAGVDGDFVYDDYFSDEDEDEDEGDENDNEDEDKHKDEGEDGGHDDHTDIDTDMGVETSTDTGTITGEVDDTIEI